MIQQQKTYDLRWQRIDVLILTTILVVACLVRLYRINTPLADWHSWRQVDTAAVARNFVRDGFDLLHPRFDDLGNVQSSRYNPNGWRMVEFPFYSAFFASLYRSLPFLSLEIYGRLVSIFFSLLLITSIYYLSLKEEGRIAAVFSALVFSIMPFFVYYSRVVLPEMTALSFIFLAITSLYLWKQRKVTDAVSIFLFIASMLCAAAALLIKPPTIFFLLPLFYLMFKKWGFAVIKKVGFYLYFILVLIPFIAWRLWILNFPEGVPLNNWLITSVNTFEGQKNIFFKPAFFRWVFYERIATLISGGYLISLFTIGLIKKPKKSLLITFIGIASLAYLLVFQGGNVQHDYYQTLILPALALFSGIGASLLIEEKRTFINPLFSTIVVIIVIAVSALFSFFQIKGFYDVDNNLVNVAKIINTITEPNSIIVTDREGDTTLLYLSDRRGYPSRSDEIDELKKRGAQYFVTLKRDSVESLRKKYPLVFESDQVFIFKL